MELDSKEWKEVFGKDGQFDKIKNVSDLNNFFSKMESLGFEVKETTKSKTKIKCAS